jgi:nucleolar protein 9
MPRENRKRGKKHKKGAVIQDDAPAVEEHPEEQEPQAAGPSWITSAKHEDQVNPEAPFGYVDADVKAYFRTVDEQLKEWQANDDHEDEDDEDANPNESECSSMPSVSDC